MPISRTPKERLITCINCHKKCIGLDHEPFSYNACFACTKKACNSVAFTEHCKDLFRKATEENEKRGLEYYFELIIRNL